MRNFQSKRQRGRNRGGNQGGGGKPQQNANRAFDSNGPDNIKVRGHAQHVYEKYQQLARDAASAGDRVLAENYLQHAEHYFRTIRALQPNKPVTEIVGRETFASGFDIDFEDETVVAAIEATDAAVLEREQNGTAQGAPGEGAESGEGGQPQGQGGGQGQGGQNQGQGGQNRPWEPRPPRGDRYDNRDRGYQNDRSQGGGDRSQNDRSQGDRYQNDRPPRDQQGGDRPRYDNRDRDQQGGDRPRYENRDRYQGDRSRDDRYGERNQGERSQGDRPQGDRNQGDRNQGDRNQGDRSQGDRGERPRYEPRDRGDRSDAPDISSPTVAPTLEGAPEPAGRVLRSEDGGVSQIPGFLAGSAAPAPSASDGDEAPKPRRRRSSKPKSEGGEPSEG